MRRSLSLVLTLLLVLASCSLRMDGALPAKADESANNAVTPLAAATATLTVNLSSVLRGVTHAASGSLYGVTETLPSDIANLVAPLKPNVFNNPARAGSGYQQPIGAAIPVAGRLASTTGRVSIRLADLCPNWPYSFPGMASWLSKVASVINDKKASGYANFYGYELWNEPDGTWNSANGDFNSVFWKQTYAAVRSSDPGARIIGPSYAVYNHATMSTFLTYCKNNGCLPDVIGWHQLSGSASIIGNINDYRALESSLGISPRLISINEYSSSTHAYEGCPGVSAAFIAKFERKLVDSACISWWFTNLPGRLGSLLTSGNAKGGGWWFYKWYGDMTGNMVSVTPPNDNSDGVDGFACVDSGAKYASICLGGNTTGTINVAINGIPSFFGANVNASVEYVPWSNKDTAVSGTTTVSTTAYPVSGGSIAVPVNVTNALYGYRVYLTPGTAAAPVYVSSGHTYKLVNRNSGKVLGITGASTAAGAVAVQWSDNGTADHNWTATLVNGYYRLKNANSGLVLGISGASSSDGALAVQWSDNGTADHDWSFTDTGSAVYKLVNRNSSKVLGISGMSTSDGAQALQWTDNGTTDHLWTLVLIN